MITTWQCLLPQEVAQGCSIHQQQWLHNMKSMEVTNILRFFAKIHLVKRISRYQVHKKVWKYYVRDSHYMCIGLPYPLTCTLLAHNVYRLNCHSKSLKITANN